MNNSFSKKLMANFSPNKSTSNNGTPKAANSSSSSNANKMSIVNKVNNAANKVNSSASKANTGFFGSPKKNNTTLSEFMSPAQTSEPSFNLFGATPASPKNASPKNASPKKNNSIFGMTNSSPKMNAVTSFQPLESIKNMRHNVMNSDAVKNFTSPIKDSFHQAVESGSPSIISIPIMIGLGILVIAFIIVLIFREQVEFALNIMWEKLKIFFEGEKNSPPSPKKDKHHNKRNEEVSLGLVDNAAINMAMPGKKDGGKEVFNIAVDKYKYDDAEPLCKSFGAELATYDQVKEAWKKGADWCNYGWVKGQAAIFPTQEATYNKLQNGPKSERTSCGVPGINGGYFDNPDLQFGVNCYGVKPTENDTDIRQKMIGKSSKTPGALVYDKKVQDFTAERSQIPLNSFNDTKWDQ